MHCRIYYHFRQYRYYDCDSVDTFAPIHIGMLKYAVIHIQYLVGSLNTLYVETGVVSASSTEQILLFHSPSVNVDTRRG